MLSFLLRCRKIGDMSKKLKTPKDYPQFQFRVGTLEEKHELDSLIDEVLALMKARWKEGELLPKRSHIMASALRDGLKAKLRKLR